MKIRNSLKSLKDRHRDNRVIRRRGRTYVINKTNRRFKARQADPPGAKAHQARRAGTGNRIEAVIFDIGGVLVEWDPRFLYERLIPDDEALAVFLRDVVTADWHFQHDAGRPFAETSAELSRRFPEHAALIAAWGPRFNDSIRAVIPGMAALVAELDAGGVPLFAITNFSGEFFPPFRAAGPGCSRRFATSSCRGTSGW